ncbi:MAG: phosphatase PAP2 family protein, partial [Colwellia sp.]|nr:phosphatase PAP2 family protein [Colwellia sp.]
ANIDNIRFPDSAWDGEVLNLLINGPKYLKKSLEFDLPPPPSNSSHKTTQELELLKKYQAKARTPEQVNKILTEAKAGDFSETFLKGGPFSTELKKAAAYILNFSNKEILYFIARDKKRFHRPRPSQLVPELILVVPNPGHAAYPSGHATQSMIMAEILALIDPKTANSSINYAYEIAERREIAGVHYPSDSKAGQYLARNFLVELMKVEEFKNILAATKDNYRTLIKAAK